MMRLFVGLDLPWELRETLRGLAGGLPGARWVPPENYHLTLRFIGETPRYLAEEIDHALAVLSVRGFTLQLAGLGMFEKGGRPQSLWVAAARDPGLDHLRSKIETALQRIGLPADRRRFAPHVSIARVDGAPPDHLAAYLQAHNLFRAAPVVMDQFVLFRSQLGKERAVYTPEVEYALT